MRAADFVFCYLGLRTGRVLDLRTFKYNRSGNNKKRMEMEHNRSKARLLGEYTVSAKQWEEDRHKQNTLAGQRNAAVHERHNG